MKKIVLPICILITGLLYIFVIPEQPLLVKILFKLIPMWLIIWYGYLQIPAKKTKTFWILLLGLFCCMLGDGLIYWFIIGLTAFLIGHLFYIAAFLRKWRYSALRFAAILPLAAYAFIIGRKIIMACIQDGNNALIIPVIIYIIVISFMAWLAIMTGNPLAIMGSILFVISDSILSWNKFVNPISYSDVLIMITYYSAQFLIARSIGFLGRGNKKDPFIGSKLMDIVPK
ncbi:lysoplasmalogenase [Bacillus sp. FJAT-49736]|uniref:lysoplasmalogenase n=1 Tax=Bacillus sp. FJAT-49736 TaxID=2833582 RepID=UPI001BC93E7D|nr:lysoplasmalogenase [Bacillus sp. FJAT-49736]MBS4172821.1 lysoplasmalogenase [Bacillus sp. FJAT-49736]